MGILQSLVLAAIVASVICFIEWSKHKPVKIARHANNYIDKNTIKITVSNDRFVNHEITKTPLNGR